MASPTTRTSTPSRPWPSSTGGSARPFTATDLLARRERLLRAAAFPRVAFVPAPTAADITTSTGTPRDEVIRVNLVVRDAEWQAALAAAINSITTRLIADDGRWTYAGATQTFPFPCPGCGGRHDAAGNPA